MSAHGVVSTINAPSLDDITQPSLVKFEIEYAAYTERVQDVNRGRSANTRITPASIKQCVRPKLLHSLCILGEIPDATTVEEASEEAVRTWFENRINTAPKDMAERVKSAIDSVKFAPCKADPGGAVMRFVLDVTEALDSNNVSEIVNDTAKCKTLVNKLTNKLDPPELRVRVTNERAYWDDAKKGDLAHFMRRASALAIEVHNGEVARAQLKTKDGKQADNAKKGESSRAWHKHGREGRKRGREADKDDKREKNDAEKSVKWEKRCLNDACDGIHRIRDCPNTNEDKKKELLTKFYAEKDKKRRMKVMRSPDTEHQQKPNGRYRVFLEENIESQALGDSGADYSALDRTLFDKILTAHPDIKRKRITTVSLETAAASGDNKMTASNTVSLTVTIILPDSLLPVRLHGVEFLVVDQPMNELLLGRPFLSAIGFDLDAHLEKVRADIHDRNVTDLIGERSRLSAMAYSNADSADAYRGMSYQQVDNDPIEPPEYLTAGFGEDSVEEIDHALRARMEEAKENGLSLEGQRKLSELFKTYRSTFGIKLGIQPPAKVPPLKVTMMPGAKPTKSPQRRYSPDQRVFLNHTIDQLEKIGAVYKNPNSTWASPALAVPKPGSNKLRFTVDLRNPNSKTVPLQSAMPHLESHLQDCGGSEVFANLDFCHGYWQIGLDESSREMMSIQTPRGVYTPTRILQGGSDAGNHFQAVTSNAFAGKVQKLLQWLDDFLIHARNEQGLLEDIEQFLKTCAEIGFRIHAEKSHFFVREVKFCGRIISKDGVKFDPRTFETLLKMEKPRTGDELHQFLCATNWMRTAIPEYAKTIHPLHTLMEDIFAKAGKRTKRAVRKFHLDELWGTAQQESFTKVLHQLSASTKLAHPKSDHRMCLFSDASDTHWAAVLTQAPEEDRKLEVGEQRHMPLSFLSGAFTGSALNWSVPEKEGFAIVESLCRLDYLVTGRCVSIFTDHANLVYIYDPMGRDPSTPKYTASKLARWAMKLSSFNYVIEHVAGSRNVWADLLTRWAVRSEPSVGRERLAGLNCLLQAPISADDEQWDWPTEEQAAKDQGKSNETRPEGFELRNGLVRKGDVIWIPQDAKLLQARILVAGHFGSAGHRGTAPTLNGIRRNYWWNKMENDVREFVRSCLHCEVGHDTVVPRPLGHTLHASRPNDLLHFDFCFMRKGLNGASYVLILKDDLSGYVWLVEAAEASAEVTAKALVSWFAAFGIVRTWVSDQGSHFKNWLVKSLQETLRVKHHFTLAYTPWSNGTVEVVCRELLRATRALLSEFKLPSQSWPVVLPIVQMALNNASATRLSGKTPLEVFIGHRQTSPMAIISTKSSSPEVCDISAERAASLLNIEKMQRSLDQMHREVKEVSDRRRSAAVRAHNSKTGVREVNFSNGDYVLRGILPKHKGTKLAVNWKGPFRVTECLSDYVFQIEDVLSGKKELAHGRRLKFFRNRDFEVTEELKEHLLYQENELLVVERFDDIRRSSQCTEVLVKWKGFGEDEMDWVNFETLKEDVPVMLDEFLEDLRSNGTPRQRQLLRNMK